MFTNMLRRQHLRSYLAKLFLAIVVPLLVLAGLLIYQVVGSERETRLRAMQDLAQTLSSAVDAEVERSLVTLQMLATSDAIDRQDEGVLRARFEEAKALHGRWSSMSLFKADGTRLFNLRVPAGQPLQGPRASTRALDDAVRAGRVFVSDVVISSTSGKPTVFFGVPVFRDGKPAYGIAATMEYDIWTDWLKQRIPEGAIAAIDDSEGVIFARSERPEPFAGKPATDAIRRAYRETPSGIVRNKNREGLDIYGAYATSQRSGWHTLIIFRADVVDAGPWRFGIGFAAAAVIVLLLTIAAAVAMARPLAEGIDRLRDAIRRVGLGERPSGDASTIVELHDAQQAAVQASDRLTAARDELVRQREDLRTMLDLLPVGVAIAHDTAAREVTLSPVLREMLGSPDGPAEHRWLHEGRVLAPDELPLQRAASSGAEIRNAELDVIRPDGTAIHVLVNAAPLLDGEGRVRGAIAAHVDITLLRAAQEALIQADEQKNQFLATLAHELRNPLAPIRYASALLRVHATPETIEKTRGIIERQSAHMARLLDDLLDLSRISRNAIQLKQETVDLRDIVSAAADNARPLADEKRHALVIEPSSVPVWVNGDPARLLQIMDNLLSNACKYTPAGGRIVVGMHASADRCELRVSDSGIGLTPEQIPTMFSLFGQVHRSLAGTSGGLGIGLSVVRQLVELHGGTIQVHSDGPDRGATFVVQLPLQPPPAEPVASAIEPVATAGRTAHRVLVVDDNVDAGETLASVLELSGFAVTTAHSATAALARLAESHPEVAVLDIGLPDGSGHDLARHIRAQAWGSEVLLIAVTGWGSAEDRERSAAAGFDVHLVKPVDAQQVLEAIAQFVPGAAGP